MDSRYFPPANGDGDVMVSFGSVAELRRLLLPHTEHCTDCESHYMESFYGPQDYRETVRLSISGDRERAALITHQYDQCRIDTGLTQVRGIRRVPVGTIRYGRLTIGHPMPAVRRRRFKRRIVILHNNCGLSDIHASTLIHVGVAVLSTFRDLLIDPDNYVEYYFLSAIRHRDKGDVDDYKPRNLVVVVRVATSPIDINSLAFVIANPSFFRRLVFQLVEIIHHYQPPVGYGTKLDLSDNSCPAVASAWRYIHAAMGVQAGQYIYLPWIECNYPDADEAYANYVRPALVNAGIINP